MDIIRLIASDLDATLLDGQSQLPPDFAETVRALAEQGIRFAAASGRPIYTLEEMFAPLRDDIIFVGDNGGAICWKGENLYVSEMDTADASRNRYVLHKWKSVRNGNPILPGASSRHCHSILNGRYQQSLRQFPVSTLHCSQMDQLCKAYLRSVSRYSTCKAVRAVLPEQMRYRFQAVPDAS